MHLRTATTLNRGGHTIPLLPLLLALIAAATGVSAVCPSGYVGLGTSQLCGTTTGCGGSFGAIFANNCHFIDISFKESLCQGGWDSGYGVSCDGSGYPTSVQTTGGTFGNCYSVSDTSCSREAGISSEYNFVDYCCSRI